MLSGKEKEPADGQRPYNLPSGARDVGHAPQKEKIRAGGRKMWLMGDQGTKGLMIEKLRSGAGYSFSVLSKKREWRGCRKEF